MTAKMQSCIDHIKTSTDVDPWAMEMVERIFTEYDKRFDKVLEIVEKRRKDINDADLDVGTIAVVLGEWLVFEKEVLELKGGAE